jgi:hypothetical protein
LLIFDCPVEIWNLSHLERKMYLKSSPKRARPPSADDIDVKVFFKSNGFLYFVGIFVAWICCVLPFALGGGYRALQDGSLPRPDPLTCTQGSCWDTALKHNFPKCTWGTGQSVLGTIIPEGSNTCYRSITFNLEGNTAVAFLVYFSFGAFVARTVEYFLGLLLHNSFRWSILFPLACHYFGFFYS